MPRRLPLLITSALFLAISGCDAILDKGLAIATKEDMKTICGDDDPVCVQAVDDQFDGCHAKYEKEWNEYMNSKNLEEEDKNMERYAKRMFSCIVDKHGDPYFVWDP